VNAPDFYLDVSLAEQVLRVVERGGVAAEYPVSTARNGAGERNGSGCTPRGWHRIRACIGAGMPAGTVFVGRRPTGETYSPELAAAHPQRDWILTRILWLGGLEPGFNRFGAVDTGRRYIYIHGSPDRAVAGPPGSHGCIRMRNADILCLFQQVKGGTRVLIHEDLTCP
jgi:lipoprotein-anchoring transpeptidase ErfK/SrfK